MTDLLRIYLDPDEIGPDGYPLPWRDNDLRGPVYFWSHEGPPIKNLIRADAGFRCERCGHPYPPGITQECPRGEWTPCDEQCTHAGPMRVIWPDEMTTPTDHPVRGAMGNPVQAQWRILTTHHLNGVKHDCRWWNLAALCQRCHLTIQGKVYMERTYDRPHSEWFRPHAAGFYAAEILGWDLTRDEVLERMDEILDSQLRQPRLEGF